MRIEDAIDETARGLRRNGFNVEDLFEEFDIRAKENASPFAVWWEKGHNDFNIIELEKWLQNGGYGGPKLKHFISGTSNLTVGNLLKFRGNVEMTCAILLKASLFLRRGVRNTWPDGWDDVHRPVYFFERDLTNFMRKHKKFKNYKSVHTQALPHIEREYYPNFAPKAMPDMKTLVGFFIDEHIKMLEKYQPVILNYKS